jgi:4-aminobutyrate aminotransferase-like enzyme
VTCAAGCAVLDALDDELLEHVRAVGGRLAAGLRSLPGINEVRGTGLLLGCELDRSAGAVAAACLEAGLVVGTAGDSVLRLTPPLIVSEEDVDLALEILARALGA